MRILAAFLTLIAFSPAAFAYVDPSSTLFAWQGGLALLGGLLVFIKSPFTFLKHLFRKVFRKKDDDHA
ncbi:hypothetical protein BI347_15450 [Chromobacterium sphagni]|uniref:Uncharacterized protein n=1 Tax=Chromobacterium sphagni TaxID=1903179 RepID=A0A1S1X5I0_9NEIS|nr:hypothetical protein [Chromobacterium sphagni]OHX14741.1 hypothetical protein BI347_15450 [Chromobacterium sphagni]